MRTKSHPPPDEASDRRTRQVKLAGLAERQHGIVSIGQLLGLGLSRSAIKRMGHEHRLHSLYRGVYAVGHRRVTARGKLMAAVLACGTGAVISHHHAAWLHDLGRRFPGRIHVTVPGRGRRGHAGIKVHCVRDLHPEDVTVIDGIPVTSLARTLVDQAALLTQQPLRRLFEEAERRGLLDAAQVGRVCERGRGRRGVQAARRATREAHPDPPMTRSELERAFLDFCRDSGIPEPSVNVWIEGQEVDMAWPDRKVVVELDSYEYHRTRQAFERDRVRGEKLAVARFVPIRVTEHRLTRETADLRTNLLSLLAVSG